MDRHEPSVRRTEHLMTWLLLAVISMIPTWISPPTLAAQNVEGLLSVKTLRLLNCCQEPSFLRIAWKIPPRVWLSAKTWSCPLSPAKATL